MSNPLPWYARCHGRHVVGVLVPLSLFAIGAFIGPTLSAKAETVAAYENRCPRPAAGDTVQEPEDLRSGRS